MTLLRPGRRRDERRHCRGSKDDSGRCDPRRAHVEHRAPPGNANADVADRRGVAEPTWSSPCWRALNFAVYSKNARAMELVLYQHDDWVTPALRIALDPYKNKTERVWHCALPGADAARYAYYAYVAHGPSLAESIQQGWPRDAWDAFDPSKILLDPYARAVFIPPGFDPKAAAQPGASTAGATYLGVLPAADDARCDHKRANRHGSDLIIYEMHVRGFTKSPTCPAREDLRGTYAGAVEMIPYLRDLGITAVELLPVFLFDPGEPNFWGYQPVSFFALHPQYCSARGVHAPAQEFREMVERFHDADIEVFLDVVYNHSGEGGARGPVYSLKGLDNSSYYMMSGNAAAPYENFTGTGNTLHCANRAVRLLIIDSLRYWAVEMGVDGFRFDEASIFSRNSDGTINLEDPAIFGQLAADPALANVRFIAEPWDAGDQGDPRNTNSFQLGRNFPGHTWMQWNAGFRDGARHAVKSNPGQVGNMMLRLYGSDDLFPDALPFSERPWQSVNYVSAHDGLTLRDVVSYTRDKHVSWNSGFEGDLGAPPDVEALRRRQNPEPVLPAASRQRDTDAPGRRRNHGHPAWEGQRVRPRQRAGVDRLVSARDRSRDRYSGAQVFSGYGQGANVDFGEESRTFAFFLKSNASDDDIYAMFNFGWEPCTFVVQQGAAGQWRRAIDTALTPPDDICDPGQPIFAMQYRLEPRSIAVLFRPTVAEEREAG